MDHKIEEPEQQGLIKSTFEETLEAVDERMKFFQTHHLSLESELLKIPTEYSIKTIGDIYSGIGIYYFHESPVQPTMRDLYTSGIYPATQYRYVLPPPSSGEESVNQHQSSIQPSFQWISKTIIDSNLLSVEIVDHKRPTNNQKPAEWGIGTEILIHNISKKIYLKSQFKYVEKILLKEFYFTRVKKIREIYYKGKPSIIANFIDQYNCAYAYYNLRKNEGKRKQFLGDSCEVYKIMQNRIKKLQELKWVAVIFRKLPSTLTREILLDILRKRNINPIWMEDLIQIDNFKYTLCKVNYLNDVFDLCAKFQINSPLKDVKVNLHPKSCKVWKPLEDF